MFKPNIAKLKSLENVPALARALNHRDRKVSFLAVQALAEIAQNPPKSSGKDSEALSTLEKSDRGFVISSLTQIMSDTKNHVKVRRDAAITLGSLGGAQALPPLMNLLNEKNELLREAAVKALSLTKDLRAIPVLLRCIGEGKLGSFAKTILKKWTPGWEKSAISSDALRECIALLDKPSSLYEEDVVKWLGAIGDIRAIEPLVKILLNPLESKELRFLAAQALDSIGWHPANDELKFFYRLAKGQLKEHSGISPLVVDSLIVKLKEALSHCVTGCQNDASRSAVFFIEALGQTGNPAADDVLIELLEGVNPIEFDWRSRIALAAINSLARRGMSRASEIIIKILDIALDHYQKDNSGYIGALEKVCRALGEIGDLRAIEVLARAIQMECVFGEKLAESALSALILIGKDYAQDGGADYARVVAAIIDSIFSKIREKGWFPVKKLAEFFGDYALLISNAGSFSGRICKENNEHDNYYAEFAYDQSESLNAVKRLAAIPGPISTNLLHEILKIKDPDVASSRYLDTFRMMKLSFEAVRCLAKEELERRGNPPHDAAAYAYPANWKISS